MAKKNKVLRVATRLFAEKGYAETSIDEIVAGAGVAKGTLFYHFPSKADLLAEILIETFEIYREKAIDVLKSHCSGIEKIVMLSSCGLSLIDDSSDAIKTLVRDVPHEVYSGSESRVSEIAEASLTAIYSIYSQAFREGFFDGTVRDVDPEISAVLLHSFIVGRAKLLLAGPYDSKSLRKTSEEFIRRGFAA